MDLQKMAIQEIDQNFCGKKVEFTLKNGNKKTIFVEDSLNEDDDEPELTFIGDSNENEIGISYISSAEVI